MCSRVGRVHRAMATHTTTPTSSATRPAASAVDAAVLSAQLLGLQDEFDMSSFQGRLGFFLRIVTPKHMLTSAAEIAAAKQRMNTDVRRQIFYIVMGSEVRPL